MFIFIILFIHSVKKEAFWKISIETRIEGEGKAYEEKFFHDLT